MTALAPRIGTNPYVGPRAFARGETLYGRDREVLDLVDIIVSERIVLLYSPSGAGKTSLLQAALIPALEAQDFIVPPVMRVSSELPEAQSLSPAPNRYVLSALSLLDAALPTERQRTLAELASCSFKDYLDQAYPAEDGQAYPVEDRHTVLVFDQLEEVITLDPTDNEAKVEFFRQVGEALRDRRRWAVFTMREDFVAGLDPLLRKFPAPLSRTFRLDLLGPDAALVALTAPAAAGGVTFDDAAAASLVDDLRKVRVDRWGETSVEPGPFVEPVQLQVAARRLWNRLDPEARSIEADDVRQLGDLDDALGDYYDEQVGLVADGVDEQRAIRDWVDARLITDQGFRSQAIGRPDGQDASAAVVRRLEDAHLLRSETRRGTTWYELAHDRLVEPIRARNAAWRQAHLEPFELQAVTWQNEGRPAHRLLGDHELEDARRWADERSGQVSPTVQDFIERSEGARRARTVGRYRRLGAIGIVVALVMASVAGIAGWLAHTAARDARIASTRELIGHSAANRETDPALSTLLALEAVKDAPDDDVDALAALHSAVNAESASLPGELVPSGAGLLSAADFSPDGQTLATASDNYTATVWDPATGQPLTTLTGHTAPVTAIAYSPDGQTLATASDDSTAILWNAATGEQLQILSGHTAPVNGVAFAPDGQTLATASDDMNAIIWNAATGTQIHTLTGHTDWVNAIAYAPDGQTLATASDDTTAIIWNPTTGQPLTTLTGHTDWVNAIAYAPDGQTLATASDDTTAIVWNPTTGQPLTTLTVTEDADRLPFAVARAGRHVALGGDEAAIHDAAFQTPSRPLNAVDAAITDLDLTASGELLVSGDIGGALRLWDVETGSEEREVYDARTQIRDVAVSDDGRLVAAASAPRVVEIIDLGEDDAHQQLPDIDADVTDLVFTPEDGVLAVALADGTIGVWDADDQQQFEDLDASRREPVTHLASAGSAEAWQLAASYADGSVVIWTGGGGEESLQPAEVEANVVALDLAMSGSGSELAVVDGSTVHLASAEQRWKLEPLATDTCDYGTPTGVGFLDGGLVAVASADGSVEVCESTTSDAGSNPLYAVAVSPDGDEIIAGGDTGTLLPWDAGKGLTPREAYASGHTDLINDLDYSPDGDRVATASYDQRAAIWDDQGNPTWLEGHSGAVLGVDFSPDGRRVATAGADGRVIVWNADTGEQRNAFPAQDDRAWDVAYSPDGRKLATVGDDKTVSLWDADTGQPIDAFGEASDGRAGHTDLVVSVAFDPDGDLLASVGADGRAIVWQVDDGSVVHAIEAHKGQVLSAAFHPTDPLLATASDDGTVLVHDMDSGDLVRRIGLASPAYSVAFSPDGSDVIIGTDFGLVVNPMDEDELVELGVQQAGRDLTPAECEEFLHDDRCPGR